MSWPEASTVIAFFVTLIVIFWIFINGMKR